MNGLAAILAPTGRLRAAINLGNPVLAQAAPDGAAGVSVALARALGRRLEVPVELVLYPTGGAVIPARTHDAWDIAFLAAEPERGREVAFSVPYVFLEATCLVGPRATARDIADLDAPGVVVAAAKGAAYELALARRVKQAAILHAATSTAAVEAFMRGEADAVAGLRHALAAVARDRPDLRLLDGAFSRIEQAIAIPGDRRSGLAGLDAFVEAMKATGFVRRALDRTGQGDVVVAPPA